MRVRIRRFRSGDAVATARCIRKALDAVSSRHYPAHVVENLRKYYSADGLRRGRGGTYRLVAVEEKSSGDYRA